MAHHNFGRQPAVEPESQIAGSAAKPFSRRVIPYLGLLFISWGLVVLLLLIKGTDYAFSTYVLTSSLAVLCLLPLIFGLSRKKFDPFEIAIVFALFYFIQFGNGSLFFLRHPELDRLNIAPYLPEALAVAILGWLCFLAGYYSKISSPLARSLPPLPSTWNRNRVNSLVLILCIIGWTVRIYSIRHGAYFHAKPEITVDPRAYWWVAFSSDFPFFATAMVGLLSHMTPLGKVQKESTSLFLILVATEFLYAIPIGARWPILRLIIMIWAIRYYGTRSLPPVKTLAIVATIFLLILPLVNVYRNQSSYARGIGSIVVSAKKTIRAVQAMSPWEYLHYSSTTTQERLADIIALAVVVRDTPELMDYQHGRTYSWLIWSFVPRFIYPDKPYYSWFDNLFGRTYRILPSNDWRTAIGITAIGEMYINFHILGVILGMTIYGLLYRLIYRYTVEIHERSPSGLLIYVVSFWPLLNGFEGIFVMLFGNMIRLWLVLWVITYTVRDSKLR